MTVRKAESSEVPNPTYTACVKTAEGIGSILGVCSNSDALTQQHSGHSPELKKGQRDCEKLNGFLLLTKGGIKCNEHFLECLIT